MLYLHAKKNLFIKIMRFQNHRTLKMTELEKADFGDFKNFEKKLGCGFHGNIIHYKGGIVSFLGHRV